MLTVNYTIADGWASGRTAGLELRIMLMLGLSLAKFGNLSDPLPGWKVSQGFPCLSFEGSPYYKINKETERKLDA